MKPALRWFGGKGTIADEIVAIMPPHRCYIEPFGGSLAVLFAKSPAAVEVVNDKHKALVNFYRVLRRRGKALVKHLRCMPWSRAEFERARLVMLGEYVEADELERAALVFLYAYASYGSCAGRQQASGFKADTGQGGSTYLSQWLNAKARLSQCMERLASVTLESRDYKTCIAPWHGKPDALIYCDPPYVRSTRGQATYQHEFGPADHARLARCLCEAKAQVMVSYYDCELVRELYPGWHITKIENALSNARRKEPTAEIVLTNYQPRPSMFEKGAA